MVLFFFAESGKCSWNPDLWEEEAACNPWYLSGGHSEIDSMNVRKVQTKINSRFWNKLKLPESKSLPKWCWGNRNKQEEGSTFTLFQKCSLPLGSPPGSWQKKNCDFPESQLWHHKAEHWGWVWSWEAIIRTAWQLPRRTFFQCHLGCGHRKRWTKKILPEKRSRGCLAPKNLQYWLGRKSSLFLPQRF